jgi:hypothetical protein
MHTNASALIIPPPGSAGPALTNDIRGVKAPVPVAGWEWVWWVLAAAALVALAVWAWRWWRKKQLAVLPEPVIPPHVRAKRKLQAALAHLQDPRLFCFHISEALRVYLEERFNWHAPERTTEEFLAELQGSRRLLPDQKQSLAGFLGNCDLVKFARAEPTEAALRELHESALRLIDETQYEPVAAAGASLGPPPQMPPPIPPHARELAAANAGPPAEPNGP